MCLRFLLNGTKPLSSAAENVPFYEGIFAICNTYCHHFILSIVTYYCSYCQSIIGYILRKVGRHMNEPLRLKKRGEDGSRVITVRIKEDTLSALDALAAETNYSRNELINIILKYGVENTVIV